MSESPLPLECIRIVLDILAHNVDIHSLSTLLRVNRFFAEATLPYLYDNPFQDAFHPTYGGKPNKGLVHITRTLLRQAPPENVTDLLMAFYFGKQDFDGDHDPSTLFSEPYVPVLNYLPHVKTLLPRTFPTRDIHSRDTHYFDSDRLASFLQISGLNEKYCNMASRTYTSTHQDYLYGAAVRQDIERQLGWALCLPETVQELTISVMDCQQYLDNVEQFKSLTHIRFTFDNQFDHNRFYSDGITPEEATAREQERHKERIERLETMVAFVQEHTRMHRKVLQTANCYDTYIWEQPEQPLYDGYQLRLLKFLPPLHNPTSLIGDSIQQFCLNPEDTDLTFVERIYMDGSVGEKKDILDILSASLHRCRALRFLNLDLQGHDLFLWAVKEKQEYDHQRDNGQVPTKALVPIESARFQYDEPRYGSQIDSFIQAFGSTLDTFAITGQFVDNTFEDPVEEPVVCGRQWSLPELDHLTMMTYLAPLILEPDALADCPVLQHLSLEDSLNGTQVTANTPSWKAVILPRLNSLTLKGSPAWAFHPGTLHNTPKLDTLCLSMDHFGGEHAIPPIQELSHLSGTRPDEDAKEMEIDAGNPARPLWTWDWHLPLLRDLVMTAEFAFCFQFRMLRQTPSLQNLYLNSSTADGLHKRTIALDDLRDETVDGFICLPELIEFRLVGRWQVEGQVWKTLFSQVAPNIVSLEEEECSGFGLQDWIEATSALKALDEAYTSLEVTGEELVAQGLKPFEYTYDPDDDTPTPGAHFNFQGGAFRYLRAPVESASKKEREDKEGDSG
ncbi:hypothetical protein BGX24_006425 [Mortierella sp. AD032]|nr:hypothetical protein BGX24_006425 [Mortierella sp. AD032]